MKITVKSTFKTKLMLQQIRNRHIDIIPTIKEELNGLRPKPKKTSKMSENEENQQENE